MGHSPIILMVLLTTLVSYNTVKSERTEETYKIPKNIGDNNTDPELLAFISFSSDVKIKSISVVGRGFIKSKRIEDTFKIPENFEVDETKTGSLVFIPFTSDVKIKSISVVGGRNSTSHLRLFINIDGNDFEDSSSSNDYNYTNTEKGGA